MGLRGKRCGAEEHVKNGFVKGKQRYRCKACGLNFTDTPPRGMPLRIKVTAVLLYLSGLSMNRTAKLLAVSTRSVQAWIERFAEVYQRVEETRLPSRGPGCTLTTSIAASVSVATTRMATTAPSPAVRSSRCAAARARNSLGVSAPTRRRMTRPRL